jgi:AAA+ ATPase superfamily predicted ATPase
MNNTQKDRQARDLFIILNTITREAIQIKVLINELEKQLQSANIPSVVLSHGQMTKSYRRFVVLEYYGPLPGHVLDSLSNNPIIDGLAIYDAPSMELEQRTMQQSLLLDVKRFNEANLEGEANYREVPAPPEPPAEFVLLSVPVPLLSACDDRWIARARGPEGEGILIYEHFNKIVFLQKDEAITADSFLSAEVRYLQAK